MNARNPQFQPTRQITHVLFSPLSGEQIQNYGVRLTKPYSHNTPSSEDTPADERLGDKNRCKTCLMDYNDCPGHFGYIPLALPVMNLNYMSYAVHVLKCVCVNCAKLFVPDFADTLKSEGMSRLVAYRDRSEKVSKCSSCGTPRYKFSVKNLIIYYNDEEFTAEQALRVFERITNDDLVKIGLNTALNKNIDVSQISMPQRYVHPHQVRPEAFVFTHLPVIPIQARPHIIQNGERKEDNLTEHYNTIIKINMYLAMKLDKKDIVDPSFLEKKRVGRSKKEVSELYANLQKHVHMLIDNKKVKGGQGKAGNNDHKLNGLTERLSSKQGHIQSNAGGKRSDQSARDVIVSAGPDLAMDQIGIPTRIAQTVTVPEVITEWNIDYFNDRLFTKSYTCRFCKDVFTTKKSSQYHIDNPTKICKQLRQVTEEDHKSNSTDNQAEPVMVEKILGPGSITSISRGRGIQDLKKLTNNFTKNLEMDEIVPPKPGCVAGPPRKIVGLRVGDKIERFLQDGDWVYMNRQPTISIESIQGFRVKVEKHAWAFQLPPPVTRGFNADYDGPHIFL